MKQKLKKYKKVSSTENNPSYDIFNWLMWLGMDTSWSKN